MKVGKDFFKILNFAIQIMRLFAQIFGDDESKQAAMESKARSANSDETDAC